MHSLCKQQFRSRHGVFTVMLRMVLGARMNENWYCLECACTVASFDHPILSVPLPNAGIAVHLSSVQEGGKTAVRLSGRQMFLYRQFDKHLQCKLASSGVRYICRQQWCLLILLEASGVPCSYVSRQIGQSLWAEHQSTLVVFGCF